MTGLEIVNLIRELDRFVEAYFPGASAEYEKFHEVREIMEAIMLQEIGK